MAAGRFLNASFQFCCSRQGAIRDAAHTAVESLESRTLFATITVTSPNDTLIPNDGAVTLREAITAVNAGNDLGDPNITGQAPGVFGVNDTINFNIGGSGVKAINVTSALPTVVKPVTINGYTQGVASVNTLANSDNAVLLIELFGAAAGAGVDGLTLGAGSGGSTVRGLVVDSFPGDGIVVQSNGNTIVGNFVGTNSTGTTRMPNGTFPSSGDGIRIENASNNAIGTTALADRNVVSGNAIDGIHVIGTLLSPATGNVIQNNFVGVAADGVSSVGNRTEPAPAPGAAGGNNLFGIEISGGNNNTVGGTTAGARNVVGFNASGISIDNGGQGNSIRGNFVGVGADGVTPAGNLLHGVDLRSSNGFSAPLGPAQANEPGVSNNAIGGTNAGAGNLIEFNGSAGVAVFGSPVSASGQPNVGNSILANSIFQNGRSYLSASSSPLPLLGIDLSNGFTYPRDDGSTANDSQGHGGPDDPNNFQNFPVLTSAVTGASTQIEGTLNAAPNTTYRVDLFANDTDPLGLPAEGQQYLGFANVTTDGGGAGAFSASFGTPVSVGRLITTTATDPLGNTSEFSVGITVNPPNFIVTTNADSGPGSLRQVIMDANAVGGHATITFNIPGPGVHTIKLLSDLPALFATVTIDGYTQPGSVPNTLGPGFGTNAVIDVEIDGNGNETISLQGGSDGSIVRGLAIGKSSGEGINVFAPNVVVGGNFVGVHADGTTPWPNLGGVGISKANDRIGGTAPADRNLIAANLNGGVGMGVDVVGSVVQGNLIGTDRFGTTAIGNIGSGVQVESGATVGGVTPAARNVIAGSTVGVVADNITGATVEGNYIGTDVTGAAALPNTNGIVLRSSTGVVVGGSAGAGNLVSGNSGDAIQLLSTQNSVVAGNFIGTNASGAGPLPNMGIGLLIANRPTFATDSQANIVGGSAAGRNVIAYNGGAGVALTNPNGDIASNPNNFNAIRFNAIYGNAGLSIDLSNTAAPDGITLNDNLDADAGPNNKQNFPVLTQATSMSGATNVKGALNSTANTTFLIDVYASDVGGFAGGATAKTTVGTFLLTTNGSGFVAFDETLPVPIAPGQFITATATTFVTNPAGHTSEFAPPVQIPVLPAPPSFSINDVTQAEGNGPAATAFTFTISRAGDTTVPASVQYATADGTATAPSDYAAVALTTVNFVANQSTAMVTVNVVGDAVVEPDETFFVNLANASGGATISDAQGTGTITNDDVAPPPQPVTVVLGPDPSAPGKTALLVTGTDNPESIEVDPVGSSTSKFIVQVNGVQVGGQFSTSNFGRIIIDAKGGDDHVDITSKYTHDTLILAGQGNDTVKGGYGADIIVGGDGNDVLSGRKGRDLIIGGAGGDGITGDEDDDLLIAAATTYDANLPALYGFMKEWTSSNSYSKRVDNIRNGKGSYVGGRKFNDASIIEDTAFDQLSGNSGTDLFFYHKSNINGNVADKLVDKSSSETAVDAS